MKHIDQLFEENNKNKFSFLLLAKDLIDHDTINFLDKELREKINVVSIKSSKYTEDELQYAISKCNFVVTGLGTTLKHCVDEKIPTLVDVNSNKVEKV